MGDSRGDLHAAREAGVEFIGVSYGFGIFNGNEGFPIVHSVDELRRVLEKL